MNRLLTIIYICVISLSSFAQSDSTTIRNIILDSVTVKADKIIEKGDTLIYSVKGFRDKSDRTIENVLKRMPGIEITKNGDIFFNGKAIEHLYIDGEDLLGDNHALGTKNLSAYKVKKVEVLRNHQHKKVLRKRMFSNEVSMNLILEDDAKNKLEGTVEAASGSAVQGKADWLRSGKLTGLYFSKKKQTVSMYKTDNTGENIFGEVGTLTPSGMSLDSNPIGSVNTMLYGGKEQFNDTHLLATNWLFKVNKDDNLRVQLSYLFDKSKSEGHRETTFFDVNGENNKQITEDFTTDYGSMLKLEMLHSMNRSDFYLSNSLSGNADFSHSHGIAVLNGVRQQQMVRPHARSVQHHLILNKHMNKKIWMMNSDFSYSFMPGRSILYNGYAQCSDMKSLTWKANTSFSHPLWIFTMDYFFGTELTNKELYVQNIDTIGSQRMMEIREYITPQLKYEKDKYGISLGFDINNTNRKLGDDKINYVICSPKFSVHYEATKNLSFSGDWSRSTDMGNLLALSTLTLYRNYHTSFKGSGHLDKTASDHIYVRARFSDFKKMLNANMYLNIMGNDRLLRESSLENGVHTSIATNEKKREWWYSLSASVSKRFKWKDLSLSLSGNYAWRKNYTLLEGELQSAKVRSGSVRLKCEIKPWSFMSFDNSTSVNFSGHQGLGAMVPNITSWRNELTFHFNVGHWQLDLNNEASNSTAKNVSFRLYSDASLSYRTQYYEIGIAMHNIFGYDRNERYYLTTITENYSVQRLRPRELMAKFAVSF